MSDPYPYFDAPPDPTWRGEVTAPVPVGLTDVGLSSQKSNADHQHDISVGGIANPWQPLSLRAAFTPWGGAFRPPQYTSLGNITFVRGTIAGPTLIGSGTIIADLPSSYAPKSANEILIVASQGGVMRLDIATDGSIAMQAFGSTNAAFIQLGNPYMIFVQD